MVAPLGPSPWTEGRRIALVHDWLTGMRGGEKVLEVLCELYPSARLYTLLHFPGSVSPTIERLGPKTSFIQRLPGVQRHYRSYLPLFPLAVETFNLDDFDLVVSTSHCVVKSVVTPGHARHLSYCHTPMRYAWDQFDAYFGPRQVGRLKSRVLRGVMAALARWDARTSSRADRFIANSRHVANRIRRYYNRTALVVYPPVDTTFYQPAGTEPGAYFLVVSALVPYKRLDVAVEACRQVGVPLRIAGQGPELDRLRSKANGNVTFLGSQSNAQLLELYRGAIAVLLTGEEDFGIVPIEAQACGRPVVALARGGALETVTNGVNGILVDDPSAEAFAEGLARARETAFDRDAIRQSAMRFSRDRFAAEIDAQVRDLAEAPRADARW